MTTNALGDIRESLDDFDIFVRDFDRSHRDIEIKALTELESAIDDLLAIDIPATSPELIDRRTALFVQLMDMAHSMDEVLELLAEDEDGAQL